MRMVGLSEELLIPQFEARYSPDKSRFVIREFGLAKELSKAFSIVVL